ncbi:hypothetical protein CTAYLR_004483 [Chrysophaeum taylorii]|uniref:AAA+ ATPase domain-containing protein n=1 Tax=Chrysophaeum taylorii TaxID=2483200 RepID=A0AAD7UA75_9STRA|nr:hypothetical protein CTAYLR_004483 [Chrysophaeum taylorii]
MGEEDNDPDQVLRRRLDEVGGSEWASIVLGAKEEEIRVCGAGAEVRRAIHEWAEATPRVASHVSQGGGFGSGDRTLVVKFHEFDARAWAAETAEALAAEREAEAAELASLGSDEREAAGTSVFKAKVSERDAAGPGGRYRISVRCNHHKFGPRAAVRVAWAGGEVRGVVWRADPLEIATEREIPADKVDVHLEPRDDGALLRCVAAVPGAASPVLDALSNRGGRAVDFSIKDSSSVDRSLNDAQRRAVRLAESEPVSLVWGPPGTGKTRTLGAIISRAARRGERVLAAAGSHAAADALLAAVDDARATKVRVGHPARLSSAAARHALECHMERADGAEVVADVRKELRELVAGRRWREARKTRRELASREAKLAETVLRRAVVFSTNAGAAFLEAEFDLVVVDEAAQALEASCWIPILKASDAGRVVLAGDHKQLAPVVRSGNENSVLRTSLFERLVRTRVPRVMLDTQYRMRPAVCDWPSRAFYGGRLATAIGGCAELVVLDTAGFFEEEEESKGGSTSNPQEARLAADHARSLEGDVCVIAPYAAQVREIRRLLVDSAVDVNTVDAFQGAERDAVVLSLTRANASRTLGFLHDDRRLNVAVTRARRHLCVVCDSFTVRASPMIASLLDYIEDHGDYRFYEPPPSVVPPSPPKGNEIFQRAEEEPTTATTASVDNGVLTTTTTTTEVPPPPEQLVPTTATTASVDNGVLSTTTTTTTEEQPEPTTKEEQEVPTEEVFPRKDDEQPEILVPCSFEGRRFEAEVRGTMVDDLRRALETKVGSSEFRLVSRGATLEGGPLPPALLEGNKKPLVLVLAEPSKKTKKEPNGLLASLAAERRARREAEEDAAIARRDAERPTPPAWRRWVDSDGVLHASKGETCDRDRLVSNLRAKIAKVQHKSRSRKNKK